MGGGVQKVLALAERFLNERIPAMTSPVSKERSLQVEKLENPSKMKN